MTVSSLGDAGSPTQVLACRCLAFAPTPRLERKPAHEAGPEVVAASTLTRLTLPFSSRMSGTLRASASGVRSSWFALTSAISSLRGAPCQRSAEVCQRVRRR